MPGITQELPQAGALPSLKLGTTLRRTRQALSEALARSRTRRVIAKLSDAQLRDIGVDRSAVLGNKPVISFDAGITNYLMSLR